MSKKVAVGLLVLASAVALATATTVRPMALEDLVRESDWIVVARPVSSYSAWDEDHRVIWTYTTVEISDSLKGARREKLVIAELGGKVGDMNLVVSGAPRFHAGEESLLFLVRMPSQKIRVLGLFQGKMQVRADPATGERFVNPTVTSRQSLERAGTPGLRRISLDSYRTHIRSLLSR